MLLTMMSASKHLPPATPSYADADCEQILFSTLTAAADDADAIKYLHEESRGGGEIREHSMGRVAKTYVDDNWGVLKTVERTSLKAQVLPGLHCIHAALSTKTRHSWTSAHAYPSVNA